MGKNIQKLTRTASKEPLILTNNSLIFSHKPKV